MYRKSVKTVESRAWNKSPDYFMKTIDEFGCVNMTTKGQINALGQSKINSLGNWNGEKFIRTITPDDYSQFVYKNSFINQNGSYNIRPFISYY